ncbi:MAG: hypothetical protein HYS55_02570 [Candidatus Omnitrophica bacterium]|nr:hypothetical protein [Candidatus Omnitrophota bacterium]
MKKCPVCKAEMVKKHETLEINTTGIVASASGDHPIVLSSSAANPNASDQLGQPFDRDYWLCSTPNCGTIVFID